MFVFKNIKTWSKKKLRVVKYLLNALYISLMAVVPSIIICLEYKLFEVQSTRLKLTGVGLILVIVLGLYAYLKIRQALSKLPQTSYNQQCFKFGLTWLFSFMPKGLVIFGFWMARDDIQLAYNTMLYCLISFVVADFVDYFFLKFIQCEDEIRAAALFDKEKDDRRDLI